MSRSSIFSFDTLDLRSFRSNKPDAWLCALAVVLLFEAVARILLTQGVIKINLKLADHIRNNTAALQKIDTGSTWFLGNSTLQYGVNLDLYQRLSGTPAISLGHGSATLRGSQQMLEYYTRQTERRPGSIVIPFTIDDLNPNGSRAEKSEAYRRVNKTDSVPGSEWLALSAARDDIRRVTRNVTRSIFIKPKKRVEAPDAEEFGGLDTEQKKKFLLELLARYSVDRDAVPDLARFCKQNRFPPPIIVLMPTTDQYIDFHDSQCPDWPYEKIRRTMAEDCRAAGLQYVDFGDPSREYSKFRDAYHLNEAGALWLTERLAGEIIRKR